MVESLYGDSISYFIGGLAIVAAASVTAWRTGENTIWAVTVAIGAMTIIRLIAFELFLANERHADRHPIFWKRLYSILGVLHLALIGSWTTVVYWRTADHFSELLSVMASLSFLIGTQGRNFSSLALIRCQLLACLIPMLLAFYARSPMWSIVLSLFVVAFYYAVLQTSRRIRGMLQQAIDASEENWRLAHTDALTGLANGISMQTTMQRAIEEREPFALLTVDLDRFKRVNDTLGHLAGNQLLRQTAATLRLIVGETGLVSREASDEFTVLQLTRSDPRTPAALAQEIVDGLGHAASINGATMPNACSVGLARFPDDAVSFETLSHRADMALFEAKAGGGGRTMEYTPGTPDRAADRLQLENDLRRALADGSIELHYQPIVENGTFRIVGCEALARWNHPTRGRISPAEFLPVAEDSGLMDDLTEQTFRAGCRAATEWPPHLDVSINLSPSQLCRQGLIEVISEALAQAGLDPGRLEIEITENMLLDGRPDVLETLHRIRALGVRLSLDDFGTGYSNLGQIALLPINKIKLDKSFLKDFGEDERLTAVLRGAVQFIAPLGFEIVLEGLETEEQLHFAVTQEGISLLQGYAFGVPMPEVAIRDFLVSTTGSARPQGGFEPVSPVLERFAR